MQRHPDYTRERLKQLAGRLRELIYAQRRPAEQILVAGPTDRITLEQAQSLEYKPARIGQSFGPLWATYWFKVRASVPSEWAGRRVDLLWISHSEVTLWINGQSVQGLNHEPQAWDHSTRPDAMLTDSASGGQALEFTVEMACNRAFGYAARTNLGYPTQSPYVLEQCDIALFDAQAAELYYDFWILQQLEAEQTKDLDKSWGGRLLSELNRFANVLDPDDRRTWAEASGILKSLYQNHNATWCHELSLIGNAHIDTAWLWPLAETYRKCVRTFSTATTYMQTYPEYKFACSQAMQFAWIKERNPDLYARIREKVKAGQFVPVGGTWVEPDCNLPSGESLVRQFLYGQRFFRQEFGITCREFWNPDVFGYNGQLPQLMRLAGITRFLTQKLSWNRFNKPHHHTFTWEGIDGSEVLTHFPPADTYNAVISIALLRDNARNYKDHDRSNESMMLFGYGDGGGGPTKAMLETIRRVRDLQGVPRCAIRSSDEFFDRLEKDCIDRPRLIGELYFEYHRGTYTSQAAIKKANRKSEFLLHDLEFLAAAASGQKGYRYPGETIERLWKTVLVNQFHDILPGSSINEVYADAARDHAQVAKEASALRDQALAAWLGEGGEPAPVNTTGFARTEVMALPDGSLHLAEAPPYGPGRFVQARHPVNVKQTAAGFVLENNYLRATLSRGGRLVSLIEKETGRESLDGESNRFLLYDDKPTNFDAWDVDPFHMETEKVCPPAETCRVSEQNPLRAAVAFEYAVGKSSRIRQTVRLDAQSRRLEFITEIDWHERQRMLKVAFDANVRSMNATCEMQFGCVERPTHFNTPYDLARYEVPAHKWVDLSEPGFGLALLSESKYGFSAFGNTLRMSLLRAPLDPDPQADQGSHQFSYALYPHAGDWRQGGVVAEAYRFNVPLLLARPSANSPSSFVEIEGDLVLDTIKKAEDSDALVLRFYECQGRRGTARIRPHGPVARARLANILEEPLGDVLLRDGWIELSYRPFEIITVLVE